MSVYVGCKLCRLCIAKCIFYEIKVVFCLVYVIWIGLIYVTIGFWFVNQSWEHVGSFS